MLLAFILCIVSLVTVWGSPVPEICISKEGKIQPKVFIITMFLPEEEAWTSRMDFVNNITIPGASPLYPDARCVEDFSICQFSVGEGEINAAGSMTALLLNPAFDLKDTYIFLNGIAGGEPDKVTTGSVTFAKYAIQVGLMYQIDSRELPADYKDWPSGYFSYGTTNPWTYPQNVYGTEVFELNENLRNRAMSLAQKNISSLSIGTEQNQYLRGLYGITPATEAPNVVACDVNTSDNYYFGDVLGDYFKNYTLMISNGTANYCSTAQEENATLESLIRLDKTGVISYDRVLVMRTISNFARPPPGMDPMYFFNDLDKGGSGLAFDNLYYGGYPVVEDIINNWDEFYSKGIKADNYLGDIIGTLGGVADFGNPDIGTV